jgi:hypothetical protein
MAVKISIGPRVTYADDENEFEVLLSEVEDETYIIFNFECDELIKFERNNFQKLIKALKEAGTIEE